MTVLVLLPSKKYHDIQLGEFQVWEIKIDLQHGEELMSDSNVYF